MPKPNVKQQIVTTSLALLHNRGFNATSVQDITAAAGVPKGSFYNHFASKEALGLEVLERYAEQASEIGAVLRDGTLAPLERVRRYFDGMIQANRSNQANAGCLLGNFSTELSNQIPALQQKLQHAYGAWQGMLAETIAEGQRDGSIHTGQTAAELADFLIDAWQGAVLRAKVEQQRAPLDRFMDMALTRVLS